MTGKKADAKWTVSLEEDELLEPEERQLRLEPYAHAGILCADDPNNTDLSRDLWAQWRSVADDHDRPVVLRLDFTGISFLQPQTVQDCLVYFMGGVLVGFRPLCVVFDGLDPKNVIRTLDSMLSSAELVAIGREAGSSTWELIGNDEMVFKLKADWEELRDAGQWVAGAQFERAKKMSRTTLQNMYVRGIALKDVGDRPFYRSPV